MSIVTQFRIRNKAHPGARDNQRAQWSRSRHSLACLSFDSLEERQLLATSAISNLLNVSVKFTLRSDNHLIENLGKTQTDLGVVQGLFQGKDTTGHQVVYEFVNHVLKEFTPNSQWVTIGAAQQVAQSSLGNLFFTQGTILYIATGTPGVKVPVLANVSSLSTAGTQAVVQIGPYLKSNLSAQVTRSSGVALNFDKVQMNVGVFASQFVSQVIVDLQAFTRKLQPLADNLERAAIPGSQLTPIWVMSQLGYSQAAGYAKTFADTIHSINALSFTSANNSAWVTLGDFSARVQSPTQLLTSSSRLVATSQIDAQLGSLKSSLTQLRNIPGLKLVIDQPQELIKLITGQAATLFTYQFALPHAISAKAEQQLMTIPVSPETFTQLDIYAVLAINVNAQASFGFDTSGYQSGNLANGFFIQNASVTAQIKAGLAGVINEANLAGFQITGALTGTVTASLLTSAGTTKVYANQLASGAISFSPPNLVFGITTQFLGPDVMLGRVIRQFGPYLKKLLGNDVALAAKILNGKGVSFDDIAIALGTIYGVPPGTTAGLLRGLNANATQIISGLRGAYGTVANQAAGLLSKVGFNSSQIAGALSTAYHLSSASVAAAIYDVAGKNLNVVAASLSSGLHLSYTQVAEGLLHSGISGAGVNEVAYAIHAIHGATIDEVAYAIWHSGASGINLSSLAGSLWHSGIGGFGFQELEHALHAVGGINLDQVAYAIWHSGIGGIDLSSLAGTLWHSGIGGFGFQELEHALHAVGGINLDQVAYAIWHSGIGGIDLSSLAGTLWHSGIGGFGLQELEHALHAVGGINLDQVAYAVWHSGIGGFNLSNLAYQIWNSGIGGFGLSELVHAIWSVGDVSITDAAYGLWTSGIGGFNLGNLASAVADAFSMSYAAALNLVRSF